MNMTWSKPNWVWVTIAFAALTSAVLSYLCLSATNSLLVSYRQYFCHWNCIAVDCYLLLVLLLAAFRSDLKHSFPSVKWPRQKNGIGKGLVECLFPLRLVGVVLVLSFFVVQTCSFAAIYMSAPAGSFSINEKLNDFSMQKSQDALYFSLVTISTVGFGDVTPAQRLRPVVVWEILSGILLFISAFPLLISRVSDFGTVTEPENAEESKDQIKIGGIRNVVEELNNRIDRL